MVKCTGVAFGDINFSFQHILLMVPPEEGKVTPRDLVNICEVFRHDVIQTKGTYLFHEIEFYLVIKSGIPVPLWDPM